MSIFSIVASIVAIVFAVGLLAVAAMLFLGIGFHAGWTFSLHPFSTASSATHFWGNTQNWLQAPVEPTFNS